MCLLSYLEPKILMSLKITMLPSNRRLRQASQGFASLLPSKCREEAEGLRSMMHVNSLFQETHQGVSRDKMYLETRFNIIEEFQIIFAIPSTLHSSELQQLKKTKEMMDLPISKLSFQMQCFSWSSALASGCPQVKYGTSFWEMCEVFLCMPKAMPPCPHQNTC